MKPNLSPLEEEQESGTKEYDFFDRRLDGMINMRHELD